MGVFTKQQIVLFIIWYTVLLCDIAQSPFLLVVVAFGEGGGMLFSGLTVVNVVYDALTLFWCGYNT